ncbi:hypothetical protein GOBAR_DD27998 [Gossypium barbadense]|nr:hypothetical protein GOBAR_DD27998 [Gossypium barbadense]
MGSKLGSNQMCKWSKTVKSFEHVVVLLQHTNSALSSWNPRHPTPCNWRGVSCDAATASVTSLDLSNANLAGPFPSFLCRLQNLSYISFYFNNINSTIPDISTCRNLVHLDLSQNLLTGELPHTLADLLNLKYLDLTGNNISGDFPASFGRFQKLETLHLTIWSGIYRSSLTELVSVVQIELYNNSLTGELPRGFSNLTNLRLLDVSMNRLTGKIPDELTRLPLESLNLYSNNLEGTLPPSIADSPALYELRIFQNRLTGELPQNLGKNSPLRWFDVSSNQFTGPIPTSLCEKGKLEEMLMIYNSFSGQIPSSLANCRSLNRIRLGYNKLSGEIPTGFWGLPHVYLLELVNNSFSGPIGKSIANAANLSLLIISRNEFNGFLPEELGLVNNLAKLSASDNKFNGALPKSIVNLDGLGILDLHGNELEGELPNGIDSLKKLNELNLANNKFSGKIPDGIGSLSVLNYLDLSDNQLTGRIPLTLQSLKLNQLNLSNNLLSGELPPLFDKDMYKNCFLGNPGLCGNYSGSCGGKDEDKHKDNVIGRGSSGKVYKVVLSSGEAVAVKKLWGGLKKGCDSVDLEKGHAESQVQDDGFQAEVETLGKIRHKNIVKLWCSCTTRDCKLLVYEYMPNGSLGDLLHSCKSGSLGWPTRYKIIVDAAEGLSYLHHDCVPPIVHRDVKSNNILLDGDFGARVADFGVAKVVDAAGKVAKSMSVIAGSCGYIAPEYAYTLRVNEKSDIYSFGVVILELVTGRLPIDPEFGEKDLVKWVCTTLDQKGVDYVLDSKLNPCFKEEMCKVLNIGLLCTSPLPINRPSMRRVVKLLQEAGAENQLKAAKKDGKLTPYYYEDGSDQGSVA